MSPSRTGYASDGDTCWVPTNVAPNLKSVWSHEKHGLVKRTNATKFHKVEGTWLLKPNPQGFDWPFLYTTVFQSLSIIKQTEDEMKTRVSLAIYGKYEMKATRWISYGNSKLLILHQKKKMEVLLSYLYPGGWIVEKLTVWDTWKWLLSPLLSMNFPPSNITGNTSMEE